MPIDLVSFPVPIFLYSFLKGEVMDKDFRGAFFLLALLICACRVEASADMSRFKESSISNVIIGPSTEKQRHILAKNFQAMGEVISHPGRITELHGEELQAGSCVRLVDGNERCNYWAAAGDDEEVMVLRNLDVYSLRAFGDSGGNAFWNISEPLCVSATAISTIARTEPVVISPPPGDIFGGRVDNAKKIRDYVLKDLNPAWGNVEIRLRAHDECVVSITLSAVKRN
jgi:hypothetical protein